MRKSKKAVHSEAGKAVRRPEQMTHSPAFETEAGLRARVRQPTARVLAERPHEWKKAPAALCPEGLYLSNEGIWQYKALLWTVDGRYRVRLRGHPPALEDTPDFDSLDSAMAWGRVTVDNWLHAGWDPYAPAHAERSAHGQGE